jgi:ribonuclease HI
LGHSTNNQSKALAIYTLGLKLINADQFKEIIIIGDSELVIKGLRKKIISGKHSLCRILQRISKGEGRFQKIEHYHVLQKMNHKADSLAKEACDFEQGTQVKW